jgi:excisionase family DNA binding protein
MRSALATVPGNDAEVLTIREAATVLRCSKAHVQNLLVGRVKDAPPLPFIPLGRRKLIRRESLVRWMERAEAQC